MDINVDNLEEMNSYRNSMYMLRTKVIMYNRQYVIIMHTMYSIVTGAFLNYSVLF